MGTHATASKRRVSRHETFITALLAPCNIGPQMVPELLSRFQVIFCYLAAPHHPRCGVRFSCVSPRGSLQPCGLTLARGRMGCVVLLVDVRGGARCHLLLFRLHARCSSARALLCLLRPSTHTTSPSTEEQLKSAKTWPPPAKSLQHQQRWWRDRAGTERCRSWSESVAPCASSAPCVCVVLQRVFIQACVSACALTAPPPACCLRSASAVAVAVCRLCLHTRGAARLWRKRGISARWAAGAALAGPTTRGRGHSALA